MQAVPAVLKFVSNLIIPCTLQLNDAFTKRMISGIWSMVIINYADSVSREEKI